MMKGMILHDYFDRKEGGGRVALTLGRNLGWAVTGGFFNTTLPIKEEFPGVELRNLGVMPGPQVRQALSLVRRWGSFSCNATTVLYSGSYTPMAVFNHSGAQNVLYCHSPPRFVYDQRSRYVRSMHGWKRLGMTAFVHYFKRRYERAFRAMDIVVANSENIQRRIRRYLGSDSIVIYPPCDIERYYWRTSNGYYLSTARLDPLKRVDTIVRTFRKLPDKRLIVASDGSEKDRLKQLAAGASNISFAGQVSDEQLRALISECIATIYIPLEEDFGISVVESMAAGKPVIGVAEGGLLETIVDGETGILLKDNINESHLVDAVELLSPSRALAMREACRGRAGKFSTSIFVDRMCELLGRDENRRFLCTD